MSVIAVLQSNYTSLKANTQDNTIFFSLLKAACQRRGFTREQLKESVFYHILSSQYPPKVNEIVEYDKLVEVLGYRKVQDLSWPHPPVAKIFLPNGNFEFVWEKDMLPQYGFKWEHYETPAEHQHKLDEEAANITDEERAANLEKIEQIFKKLKGNEKANR